ncbi:MAG TPA: hypothetical protein VIM58_12630 [Candidatus Methylacidiphilales bacterium]
MSGDAALFRTRRGEGSFTLVLVLMSLLLLSGIIVSFLSVATTNRALSSSSVSSAQAELLARDALDTVLADFLDEIAAGSKAHLSPVADPGGTNGYYTPLFAAAAVPQRIGDFGVPNVVKTSQPGLPFWYGGSAGTNGPARVLPRNGTDRRSSNGLRVAASRWLLPGLMGTSLPAAFASSPPGWILLTPSGAYDAASGDLSRNDLTNSASARFPVGRFAYVVYDVGGLADITVAGGALGTEANGRRFRAGQISLGSLPGILNAAAIVNWRDGGNATNAAVLLAATNTFASVPAGAQTFLGRQDLLRFQKDHPSWLTPEALQYLTVFSRSVNRPYFTAPANVNARAPVTPAVSYASSATYRNPPEFLDVRRPDGTPVMANRFPLSRLQLLSDPASNAADIFKYFGLTLAPDGYSWLYRGSTSSTILTLAQVAALTPAREPDFFEVLQAAILGGSLGQAGKVYSNVTTGTPNKRDGESLVETRDRDADLTRHVLQIGANLIDQYDADDYPTLIQRTVASTQIVGNNGANANANIAGVENLPYIENVAYRCYRLNQNSTDSRVSLGSWFHFEFWNPHQNAPQSGSGTTATPSRLRVVATEGVANSIYSMAYVSPATGSYVADPASEIDTPLNDYCTAYANDPLGTPYQIQFDNAAGFSDPAFLMPGKFNVSTPGPGQSYANEGDLGEGQVGILVGSELCPSDPYPPGGMTNASGKQLYLSNFNIGLNIDKNGRRITWEAQFKDAQGKWRTYQRFGNLEGTVTFSAFGLLPQSTPRREALYTAWKTPDSLFKTGIQIRPFARLDPRGERFGLGLGGSFVGINQPLLPTGSQDVVNSGSPDNDTLFFPKKYSSSSTATISLFGLAENLYRSAPTTTGPYMADRDGVVRHGDPDNSPSAASAQVNPLSITDAARLRKRPVVLNRPFASVGEMGYAFRDLPWKTIDFSSSDSGDAALLDFFTCEDPYGSPADRAADKALRQTALLRGKVSLNTRQPAVLGALVDGAMAVVSTNVPGVLGDPAQRFVSAGTASVSNVLQNFVAATRTTASASGASGSPLVSRGDLVAALSSAGITNVSFIKTEKEATLRALSDLGDTQTWNLLIDVIVQGGRYAPQAATADAENFLVASERRYWLHVAIDRANGRVVDTHLEPVDE